MIRDSFSMGVDYNIIFLEKYYSICVCRKITAPGKKCEPCVECNLWPVKEFYRRGLRTTTETRMVTQGGAEEGGKNGCTKNRLTPNKNSQRFFSIFINLRK